MFFEISLRCSAYFPVVIRNSRVIYVAVFLYTEKIFYSVYKVLMFMQSNDSCLIIEQLN